ncbi:T9SS type A sorting domain-containing protein [Lacibacter sp. H375]|uniref:T9SS type A sorting domain-containing protein n=1 Tax=Lacibacter sp. H375 TaxID=3133424 RepID=UPI0030C5F34A
MNFGTPNSGLDDGSYLGFIGADSDPTPNFESPSTRIASITGVSQTKTMERRYINRSTTLCNNLMPINPGESMILLDLVFTLVNNNPEYYNLNQVDYGFYWGGKFIAQFLTKQDGHFGALKDIYKEIAIIIFREQGTQNPYQPFDVSNCNNNNFAPVTVKGDDIAFIYPVHGILAGKAVDANLQDKDNHVLIQWKSEYNQLVDFFEVQRKDDDGEFKTIGLVMGKEGNENFQYEFKDKITARDIEPSYRIKVINNDEVITYSDVKKIRLGSEQSISVKVFPNPSSDNIRINLPAVENGSLFVCRMYSTEGRIVKVTNVSAANPSVDIKSLSVGSYFMELYNPKSGKRFYTQFSKQ